MSSSHVLIPNELVSKARRYATVAHGDQKYGEEFPYIIHPTMVEGVLLRFGDFNADRRACAYLHDVLEDTEKTYEELVTFFGVKIADMVAALTEPKGGNRKWRHEMTYPRIRANTDAIIVKLADRIANVEAGGSKTGMYWKEHSEFKTALFHPSDMQRHKVLMHQMWNYLDDLLIALGPKKAVRGFPDPIYGV